MIRHAPNTEHFLVCRSWGIPKHSKLVASTFRKFDPFSPSRCLAVWLFPTCFVCFVKVSRSLRYYVEKPGMRRCKRIGSQRPRGATSKGAVSCSFHIILGGEMPCHTAKKEECIFARVCWLFEDFAFRSVSDSSTACGWCCCPSRTLVTWSYCHVLTVLCAFIMWSLIRRPLNFRDGHCIWRVFHWREADAWQTQHHPLSTIIHHPARAFSLDLVCLRG